MKLGFTSKFSAAKTSGGLAGGLLGTVAVMAGFVVFVGLPVVTGFAAGLAVAGAVPGVGGAILGGVTGWIAASFAAIPSLFAAAGVIIAGSMVAGIAGAVVSGVVRGVGKLFGFGKKKGPQKPAIKITSAPEIVEKRSDLGSTGVKSAFDAAVSQAVKAGNDNRTVPQQSVVPHKPAA